MLTILPGAGSADCRSDNTYFFRTGWWRQPGIQLVVLIVSGLFSVVLGHVSLLYPTGGETLTAGNNLTIEWSEDVPHTQTHWDVYYSTDDGTTWRSIQLNLPAVQRSVQWVIITSPSSELKIRVVQDNQDIDYEAVSGTINILTPTETESDEIPGTRVLLGSLYPNPVSDEFSFQVESPRSERLQVRLYNMLGQQCASAMEFEIQAGVSTVRSVRPCSGFGPVIVEVTGNGIRESRILFVRNAR